MNRIKLRAVSARARVFNPENRLMLGIVLFAITIAAQAFAYL